MVRGDLDMPAGKLAAQAGHAFTDAVFEALATCPDMVRRYRDGRGSKVVLKARNLADIERTLREARDAGLPCALVTDANHILPPHFDGSPIVTALGIGPCAREAARAVLRRLRCV